MTRPQIYPMSNHDGYGIAVNGNFAEITFTGSPQEPCYTALVSAFATDSASQYNTFQDLDEAIEWALSAARTHQGKPHSVSRIVHWEHRNGYAITIEATPEGQYRTGTIPMWINDDDHPYLNDIQDFPTMPEALEYAREQVDWYSRSEAQHRRMVQEIGERLQTHAGEGELETNL